MNWAMAKEVGVFDYLMRRVLWRAHRAFGRPLAFRLPDGARVSLSLESPFASDIYCTQGYVDWGAEQLLVRYLQTMPKGLCIDVGANMGYYTCILSPHAQEVIAFEPDPRNHAALRAQKLANVTLRAEAVSDTEGTASFDVSDASTVGHLHAGTAATAQIQVTTTTLDACWSQQWHGKRVTAVKMDVEGYEIACLRGAHELTRASKPVYLIEFGTGESLPNSVDALDAFLSEHRYDIYAMIRRDGGPVDYRTRLERVRAGELPGLNFKMLFLVPPSDVFFASQAASGFEFESIRQRD